MKDTVAPFIASASVADKPFNMVLQSNSNKQASKITIDKDDVKMFAPYNPAKNGVVAEFMQSDAHKRLMMVYGRRA